MLDSYEKLCLAWLSCSDSLTYRGRERLKAEYATARAVFDNFSGLMLSLVGEKAYQELADLRDKGLEKLKAALLQGEILLSVRGDETYPEPLVQIQDAPDLLFYRGTLRKEEPQSIAIVGSRRETRYGREQAFKIARDLAASGVTVVSGLAHGIDTAAHKGALDACGRTIAVLGSGIKRMYPTENLDLAEQIIKGNGAVISEFAPKAEPLAFHFPFRNRLVSGLSQGVLLIEAREKSGTLITIGHALAQGREVFALPGQVDAPGSAAPNRMLREGARLITCASDIMEDMGWGNRPVVAQTSWLMPDLTNGQRKLYDALCDEPRGFADLSDLLGMSVSELHVLITQLELEGLIETLPGRTFRRIPRS
jgi:DNA processing protein